MQLAGSFSSPPSQCAMQAGRIVNNHSISQMRGGEDDKLAGEAEGTLQAAENQHWQFAFARAQAS